MGNASYAEGVCVKIKILIVGAIIILIMRVASSFDRMIEREAYVCAQHGGTYLAGRGGRICLATKQIDVREKP